MTAGPKTMRIMETSALCPSRDGWHKAGRRGPRLYNFDAIGTVAVGTVRPKYEDRDCVWLQAVGHYAGGNPPGWPVALTAGAARRLIEQLEKSIERLDEVDATSDEATTMTAMGVYDVLLDTDEVVSPNVIEAMVNEAVKRAYPGGPPLRIDLKRAGLLASDCATGDVPALVRAFLAELPGLGPDDFAAIRQIYERGIPWQ